jgi:four helix bundle protein
MHNLPTDDRTSSSILEHAISIAEVARPLVATIQRKDRDLASQIRRAVSSIGLNAAEAQGNSGGNSRVRFESALGSLYEARAGLLLAIGWGYISDVSARAALRSLNSLGGRLYGLAHPERNRR